MVLSWPFLFHGTPSYMPCNLVPVCRFLTSKDIDLTALGLTAVIV